MGPFELYSTLFIGGFFGFSMWFVCSFHRFPTEYENNPRVRVLPSSEPDEFAEWDAQWENEKKCKQISYYGSCRSSRSWQG